jgi:hypothetical protein
MPLAEGCGAVAVGAQYFGNRSCFFAPVIVIAGVTGGRFRDGSINDLMIVSAGQKRGARGRAKRVHMKVVIAKAAVRELVKGWRGNDSAKGRGCTIADIVDQNQDDIGCAHRRLWETGPLLHRRRRCALRRVSLGTRMISRRLRKERCERREHGCHRN